MRSFWAFWLAGRFTGDRTEKQSRLTPKKVVNMATGAKPSADELVKLHLSS